jgi:hypothetical protein
MKKGFIKRENYFSGFKVMNPISLSPNFAIMSLELGLVARFSGANKLSTMQK